MGGERKLPTNPFALVEFCFINIYSTSNQLPININSFY